VSLDCVIYCAYYSIFFRGGGVFSGHGVDGKNQQLFLVSGLKDEKLIKEQTYVKHANSILESFAYFCQNQNRS